MLPATFKELFLSMENKGMRIAIVSDAFHPQVNGVATTIAETQRQLERRGHTVRVFSPRDFGITVPLLTYSEIRIAPFPYRKLKKLLDEFAPDAIHIAVEGPLGFAARNYCVKHRLRFTTAYHTRFPEYVNVRTRIPLSWIYPYPRWFHNGSARTMVASETLKNELEAWGFKNLSLWGRGVDTTVFTPEDPLPLPGERPIFMYMGRLAAEKNIDAFLKLDLPGTKYVVGDGPERKRLERTYPKTVFTGYKFGRELARHLAAADVFVFPSLTDTLGLVMLEANACGTPIAALASQASHVVVRDGENGVVSDDLREACMRALELSRTRAREVALERGWDQPTDQFIENLVTARA